MKLVTSSVACEWLLRRYRPRLNWRPRVTTIFVLMIVSAPTLLANFSFDVVGTPSPPYMMERWVTKASFGWPLTWYWCVLVNGKGLGLFRGWDYSAVRLAGNLVIWLLMFTVVGLTWEWRSRRYWPQLRWSLRTMLVAVGLVAVVCAWCAAARNRAQEQDALIALAGDHNVWVERWGPKWLDLVGADRFRQLPWSRASFLVQLGDVNASRAVERRTARSAKLAGAAGELVCKLLMP
ncbi:MAG TPA: hypothetical protein VGX78_10895 [Pirellulales bacterium]|nr:hypothetical protein [Pirellulales bacterium]